MTDTVERQVMRIAADVFDVPLGEVTLQTSSETLENWDSLRQLNFVLALEARLGVRFKPQDLDQIRSVGSAVNVVRGKLKR